MESMYLDMIHRGNPRSMCRSTAKSCRTSCTATSSRSRGGWYTASTSKSVQIKYPNPKQDHEVLVSFEQFDLIGM